jgi:hypothetical protein
LVGLLEYRDRVFKPKIEEVDSGDVGSDEANDDDVNAAKNGADEL